MAVDVIARGLAAKALQSTGGDISEITAELENKVDKITTASANPQIYGVDENGSQKSYFATQTPNANTIPLRDASGRFQAADGIAPKQVVNKGQLDTKIDIAGGTFAGDVAIRGNLAVTGTTTTEHVKQLAVEDAVIITNVNKEGLQSILSGIAINKNANATYGIMYDPADDAVKFGEGTIDDNKNFAFKTSEGAPLATRVSSDKLVDSHIIIWNAQNNSLADGDIAASDIARLGEANVFDELNTFNQAVQLNNGLDSDGNISVTNAIVKVMDNTKDGNGNTKDYVAQYGADEIVLEENGARTNLSFPKKSGTFALLDDITSESNLKYSKFETDTTFVDSNKDQWKITNEEGTIAMLFKSEASQTEIGLSRNYIGIQAVDLLESTKSASVVSLDTTTISAYVTDEINNKSTTFTIDKDGAKLNDKLISTSIDLEGKINVLEQTLVNQVYVRTEAGVDTGLAFTYSAEGNTIAKRSAAGTLAVETPTQPQDAANKEFVETQCVNIPVGVQISDIAGSTSGLVADDNLVKLQASPNNYILKDGKKYERSSERPQEDSLTYVYNGYISNREVQEAIEITVSAKSWVLNADKLLTDRTIANGKIGGVSIKADFADGLEVAQSDGNLSIYGALDTDIAERNSKRPITTINLNKAVIAALSDDNKQIPTADQIAAFKAAWNIAESQYSAAVQCLELTPSSAQNGTLSEEDFNFLAGDDTNYIKLNNEYYYLSDAGHTEGIRSYTHNGWNGTASQDKSINITLATKAWTLAVGSGPYYRHYVQLSVDGHALCYDFLSTRSTEYTADTLIVQPDSVTTVFALISNGYYSTVSGHIYRDDENNIRAVVHGIYTVDGTSVAYLSIADSVCTFGSDTVVRI